MEEKRAEPQMRRRVLLLLAGHGFTGTAAGAGVGAGALAAHRQTGAMAAAPQAADVLQTLEGHALLAAQVTLKGVTLGGAPKLLNIGVAEVLDTGVRVNAGLGEDLLGPRQPDPIDVGESNLDPLVARDIDTGNPSHR